MGGGTRTEAPIAHMESKNKRRRAPGTEEECFESTKYLCSSIPRSLMRAASLTCKDRVWPSCGTCVTVRTRLQAHLHSILAYTELYRILRQAQYQRNHLTTIRLQKDCSKSVPSSRKTHISSSIQAKLYQQLKSADGVRLEPERSPANPRNSETFRPVDYQTFIMKSNQRWR